jgi:CRP-like cAMP-binding protein
MELEMEKDKGKSDSKAAMAPPSKLYKPDVALAFFKAAGKPEQFAPGKAIFVENEGKASIFSEGSRMYILLDGDVELSVGKKPIGAVAKGEVFGEMASLTQLPRSATALAKTPCTVISLNEKQFQEALGKSPEFALMLMAIIIGRLRDTIAQVGSTLSGTDQANKATVFDKKLLADLQKEMEDKPPLVHHLNKVIMKEGDRGIFMYVVMDGTVAVTIQEKPVEKVGPGGVFGEIALVDQSARVATATAETDCTLLSINRNDFLDMVKTKPAFALSLLKALSERLRFMTSKLTK